MKSRLSFTIGYLCFVFAVVEVGSMLSLYALKRWKDISFQPISGEFFAPEQKEEISKIISGRTQYHDFDSYLGWTIKPNGHGGLYTADARGIRNTISSLPQGSEASIHIATFGDSYTHGDEVGDGDTWESDIERLQRTWSIDNYGVPGYGIDQALLRYEQAQKKSSWNVVTIGFMTEDINRSVNVFHAFYPHSTYFPFTKPRFKYTEGKLELVPNPFSERSDYQKLFDNPWPTIQRLGENDWYFHHSYTASGWDRLASIQLGKILYKRFEARDPALEWNRNIYDPKTEAYQISRDLIFRFYREVESHGELPIVILFPYFEDLQQLAQGAPSTYKPLLDELGKAELRVVDTSLAFKDQPPPLSQYFRNGHYSPRGNELIAKFVMEAIEQALGEKHEQAGLQ